MHANDGTSETQTNAAERIKMASTEAVSVARGRGRRRMEVRARASAHGRGCWQLDLRFKYSSGSLARCVASKLVLAQEATASGIWVGQRAGSLRAFQTNERTCKATVTSSATNVHAHEPRSRPCTSPFPTISALIEHAW
jgi:hypothetical protein